jgi:hypothetical protein
VDIAGQQNKADPDINKSGTAMVNNSLSSLE